MLIWSNDLLYVRSMSKPDYNFSRVHITEEQYFKWLDNYLNGGCTCEYCPLCRKPKYARKEGMYHAGITGETLLERR